MHTFKSKVEVEETIDAVFNFFNRPENLEKLMPPFMSFTLLTPGQLIMKEGAVFDYKVKTFGVSVRWTTYISHYDPPHSFEDIQLKGPNSYWHHRHSFKETEHGTLMEDSIHFELPFGIIGKLGYFFIMKPIINALFKHRTAIISQHFKVIS